MGDAGEVSATLRLKLDKVAGDVNKGAQQIRSGLATSAKGWDIDPAETKRRQANRQKWKDIAAETKRDEEAMLAKSALRKPPVLNPPAASGFHGMLQRLGATGSQLSGAASAAGIPGAGTVARLAASAGPAAIAIAAVAAAALVLRKVFQEVTQAIESARRMYARNLSSGFGGAAGTKRALLADVIGVSEQEVYRYGAAIESMGDSLEHASKVLNETNPTLTAVGWEFKILEADMAALWATIATNLAPVIQKVLILFENMAKLFTDLLNNPLVKQLVFGGLNVMNMIGGPAGRVPPPAQGYNRLTSSTFERMGLVIGSGGAASHAKETAKNTKETAAGVKALLHALAPRSGSGGMNPSYNMP